MPGGVAEVTGGIEGLAHGWKVWLAPTPAACPYSCVAEPVYSRTLDHTPAHPKRGENWTVAGGVYASKPRPAVIVQDDLFSETASVTVVPLNTTFTAAPLLRIHIPASALSGLERDSDLMVDKLTTVRRSSVQTRVGRLATDQLAEVERALMTFLGLAR